MQCPNNATFQTHSLRATNSITFEIVSGFKCYDGGDTLYLPIKMSDSRIETEHPSDGSPVTIIITYKKKLPPRDCVRMYNVIFNNIAKVLGLSRLGRQFFNHRAAIEIPQHKLEVWPG